MDLYLVRCIGNNNVLVVTKRYDYYQISILDFNLQRQMLPVEVLGFGIRSCLKLSLARPLAVAFETETFIFVVKGNLCMVHNAQKLI